MHQANDELFSVVILKELTFISLREFCFHFLSLDSSESIVTMLRTGRPEFDPYQGMGFISSPPHPG